MPAAASKMRVLHRELPVQNSLTCIQIRCGAPIRAGKQVVPLEMPGWIWVVRERSIIEAGGWSGKSGLGQFVQGFVRQMRAGWVVASGSRNHIAPSGKDRKQVAGCRRAYCREVRWSRVGAWLSQ